MRTRTMLAGDPLKAFDPDEMAVGGYDAAKKQPAYFTIPARGRADALNHIARDPVDSTQMHANRHRGVRRPPLEILGFIRPCRRNGPLLARFARSINRHRD